MGLNEMSDRLIEQDIQKAIRLVETLDKRLIDCIYNDSFSMKDMGLIYQQMEAAGLNPKDQNDWIFLHRAAKERRISEKQCPLEFTIEKEKDRYVISPIKYHDGAYEVSWSRELLDDGNNHTQDGWIENLKDSEWSLPSGPLYSATFKALDQNKDGNNKELIKKLRTSFKEDFVKHI